MSVPLRLLVIEDCDDDAELLLARLRRAGYAPDHLRVDNARALTEALDAGGWDLIISDYAMPGFSGLDALRMLRERHIDTPFILVSGTVGEDIAVEAMRSGANDYIMKDNLTRLLPAINRELRESRERAERRRAEEALYHERERALVTLHSIGDGVITTDAEGQVDYLNPVAERLTGWSAEEAQGQPLDKVLPLIDEATHEPIDNPARTSLRLGRSIKLESQCLLINREGEEFHIEDSAAPIFDRDRRIIGAVLVFHDVTRERRLACQMSWQASHDPLTGLVNRASFAERMSTLFSDCCDGQCRHALLYLDLDQFKVINDTCGHEAGDEMLRQLSRILVHTVPVNAALARLGGDEFGILLEDVSLDDARALADKILTAIGGFTFEWEGQRFDIGGSIGLVPIDHCRESPSRVLSAADVACYVAKEAGRNRVHVYQESDVEMERHHREMYWVTRIRDALEEDRFVLFRQSIVSLDGSDSTPHCELLLRMRAPNGDIVPPGHFIPAAERFNLMNSVDRWVIEHGFEHIARHLQEGDDCIWSINLSGNSLNDDGLVDFIARQLRRHDITAGNVCFEITETAAVFNLARASHMIRALKHTGFRFALDDFGSGLSSFGYLKNLPVDFLKIDGNFVRDMAEDPMDRAIVEAINQVGHTLGIRTVAEFVESGDIAHHLRELGVDYAQGYYFSRPAPLDASATPSGMAQDAAEEAASS